MSPPHCFLNHLPSRLTPQHRRRRGARRRGALALAPLPLDGRCCSEPSGGLAEHPPGADSIALSSSEAVAAHLLSTWMSRCPAGSLSRHGG
eukprot:3827416-Alexandrium_andersonii.AAC.1